jgi:hypothetical protein
MQCPKCGEPIILVKVEIIPVYDVVQRRRVYEVVTLYQCLKCKGKASFRETFSQPDKDCKLPDEVMGVVKDADESFKWFDAQHEGEKMSVVVLNKIEDGESETM